MNVFMNTSINREKRKKRGEWEIIMESCILVHMHQLNIYIYIYSGIHHTYNDIIHKTPIQKNYKMFCTAERGGYGHTG